MIEGIIIGIIANLITGLGQTAIKKIINEESLEGEITKAFNNALDKWSINYDIKEKQKIFTRERFSTLIDCVKDPEKIKELDKPTTEIIEYFKIELQNSLSAWNYIQDLQFQTSLNKLNTIEVHIQGLETNFIQQLKKIEEIFDDVLISFNDAFRHQLDKENFDLPNQFHNKFIGRESDLETIDYLVKFSDKRIITIAADGGFGKTRICVEYYQKYIETDDKFEAFVLNTSAFNGLNFSNQLIKDKINLILIDDAHKNPKILNDFINATSRYENVKIIMTIRRALYDDTISEIATHNRNIGYHKIIRLSYEETQQLFKSQLPGIDEIELKKLADESKGIPIVVLGLCLVTINGKYKSGLSEESNFNLFVIELKKQIIDDIHHKYLIAKENINKTIELLSFFSPIKNNENEIAEFSKLNRIEIDETSLIFDYLAEHEFISKDIEIYIKPDPYSDIILLNSSARIKYLLKKDIKLFIDRLIRNLVEVEQSERLGFNLNSLLSEFISSFNDKDVETLEDVNNLVNNLETLKSFAYKKPRICFYAINHLISSKLDIIAFWENEDSQIFYEKSFKEVHENIETILSISALNTHNELELEEIYELMWKYKLRKKNSRIFQQVFRFRVYDFAEYGYHSKTPFERHFFLLKKLNIIIESYPQEEHIFNHILECLKTLIVLEFEGDSFYDKYTHAVTWRRFHVQKNEYINKIRIDSLNLLFKTYNLIRHKQHSDSYLDPILRILFFMSKSKHDRPEFDQNNEVKIVIDFIQQILNETPSINERSTIIKQLKIFERREIKEEYREIVDKLLINAENVTDKKEKIKLLFLDEYFSVRKNVDEKLNIIINNYQDDKSLFKDIIESKIELIDKDFTNFYEILSSLIKTHPEKSKELLDFVISTYPEEVCFYSSLIKANYKDDEYFYSIINKIWSFEFECVKGAVLWQLTYGRNCETELFREDDLKYFEYVVDNGLIEQLRSISFVLPKYIKLNPNNTLNLISKVLEIRNNEHENGFLIHSIFEDKEIVSNNSFLIKDFLFSSTLRFPLDFYNLDDALLFLEDNFGFELLFTYLVDKINLISKKENFFNLSYNKNYHNPKKINEQSEIDFLKVIKWYAELEKKSEYIERILVKFLRPIEIKSEKFKTEFKLLIEDAGDDIGKVVDLCKALDVYKNKGEYIISILIEVANEICEKDNCKKAHLYEIFGNDFVDNLGSRSGIPGQPFPEDLNKRDEIIGYIDNYKMHPNVKEVFNYALSKVNHDIERERNIDSKW